MKRHLAELLDLVTPADTKEAADLRAMKDWLHVLEAPTSRAQPQAHFTASAVVVDVSGERVCLLLHRKLQRWLQPGGHIEAEDTDVAAAALREAREETGMVVHLYAGAPQPLDVDVHRIPARQNEASHLHLDVRFLGQATDGSVLQPQAEEADAGRWCSWDEAMTRADEAPLRRMLAKARRCVSAPST